MLKKRLFEEYQVQEAELLQNSALVPFLKNDDDDEPPIEQKTKKSRK
jgi:hypothetical protein